MIRFFNTLTGKTDEFAPIRPGEVKMYTCGPTVYDYAHIGNFRAFVFEDLLCRFLEFKGFKITHVMNLTDVDDKTIAGAARENKKLDDFTAAYIQAFNEDLKTLNCLPPTLQPRATKEIPAMLALIEKLVKKEIAYVSDGSVYYRVSKFENYGKLSKKKLEKNITGARVDVDEYDKEQGSDFVLWKKSKEGEPSWDSPWGGGRPGWHIECSAMSIKELGETFDIHAGGEDLIFPHHENEIAQSEAATGKKFVNYWLHCKFLLVNGEKMSKSKGNFYTLRDLFAKGYDPMAIRYALLSTHYRSPLNFTLEGLKETSETIKRMDDCYFQCLSRFSRKIFGAENVSFLDQYLTNINGYLENDLNVAASLAELSSGITAINSHLASMSQESVKKCLQFFKNLDRLFGFDITEIDAIPSEIAQKVQERDEKYRNHPDFKKSVTLTAGSDSLRAFIVQEGWLVKDGKPGEPSTVKKKRRVWDK